MYRGMLTQHKARRRVGSARRRAVILIVVLIVCAMLTLAAYTFSSLMVTYRSAAKIANRQCQAEQLLESGAEAVRLFLMQDKATRQESGGAYDNPAFFQAIPVVLGESLVDRADFTVVAPIMDEEGNLVGTRYGLEDESIRVNLNALLLLDKAQKNAGRDLLMGLPGMTEDIADAILDWIDEDDDPRDFGAESDYYMGLDPPYAAKNGPLDTVEELLLVRDITPELLFGADTNRNGTIDPNETETAEMLAPLQTGSVASTSTTTTGGDSGTTGDASADTTDSTDTSAGDIMSSGSMDRGWAGYLTLSSAENNVNADGEPRIDLNSDDLETLYDSLAERLNEDWAKFIVAYRQFGAYDGSDSGTDIGTVGDLDLTQQGKTKLTQVLDLIGKKVQINNGGDDKPTVVAAAFPNDPVSMAVYLPVLMDNTTINPAKTIPGRININQAPRAILQGIPGMDADMVEQILAQRYTGLDETNDSSDQDNESWIMMEGIVTLDQMKKLMPFVCAGGDVYRAQIVGYYEDGGAAARAEVIIDATGAVPRIVSWKDISHLGRGYPLDVLGVQYTEGVGGGTGRAVQ